MTLEEIKALSEDEIKTRKSEIDSILEKVVSGEDTETDVDALNEEVRAMDERLVELRKVAE
jgi:hypothetical protein